MTLPAFIPRTKIGANGERFFNIPGVYYPPEVLKGTKESKIKHCKRYDKIPKGYITTGEAARIFGVSPSDARLYLHMRKSRHIYGTHCATRKIFWLKSDVEKALSTRMVTINAVPDKWIVAKEATNIIGCVRSSLQRYIKKGRIRARNVRLNKRHQTIVMMEDVLFMKRMHAKEREYTAAIQELRKGNFKDNDDEI